MDSLSERARNDYLFARTAVGREFEMPVVQACHRSDAPGAAPTMRTSRWPHAPNGDSLLT